MNRNTSSRQLWRCLLLALAAPLSGISEVAAPPAVEKTVLFAAGENGYSAYRIPAMIVTPQQTVLVAAEGRRDGRGDWGHIDIFYRRSRDSGRTWDGPRTLVAQSDLPPGLTPNTAMNKERPATGGAPLALTISNATWLADSKTGRTLFLFCVEYQRCFIIESADGGETFTRPREITSTFESFRSRDRYPWRVIATGPGHGAQLASGRLVVPVWLSTSTGSNAHHPSICGTIFSDDGGKTWQAGAVVAGQDDHVPNPSETAIVETEPNRALLIIRSESPRNRKALTWSMGGATGWSRPEFNESLWEPVCMASVARLPDGGLIFANPASLEKTSGRGEAVNRRRQNLGLRLSRDDGRTWSAPQVLEAGPSAYSDVAVAPDGNVLCFYEHGKKGPYESMTLARIPAALIATLP
jgi:sialidase-1